MMKEFFIDWKGKRQKAKVLKSGSTLWVHVDGEVYTYESNRSRKKGDAVFSYGDMKSPMPGKIMKIIAKTGQTIKEKETLIVLEAMKMEYTIKAPKPVLVDEIFCEVGQQVKEGQNLLKVSEPK